MTREGIEVLGSRFAACRLDVAPHMDLCYETLRNTNCIGLQSKRNEAVTLV